MEMKIELQTQGLLKVALLVLISLILVGCAPEKSETITVGVVNLALPLEPILEGFKAGMKEAGYVEGVDIIYIYDGPAPNPEALDGILENLKNENVDLVLTFGTLATLTAKEKLAGTDIPIIFGPVTDPVASGIVTSVLNPGGNITGIQTGNPTPKRLEWLLKIDPEIKRLFVIHNPDDNSSVQTIAALMETAPTYNLELVIREATTPEEITAVLNEMPEDVDAIFLPASAFFERHVGLVVAFANQQNLPVAAPATANIYDGALTTYGHDNIPLGRQASRLADQIFNGILPADLPVESAELFLAINLDTANIIGLNISDEVLEAADIVIR